MLAKLASTDLIHRENDTYRYREITRPLKHNTYAVALLVEEDKPAVGGMLA